MWHSKDDYLDNKFTDVYHSVYKDEESEDEGSEDLVDEYDEDNYDY